MKKSKLIFSSSSTRGMCEHSLQGMKLLGEGAWCSDRTLNSEINYSWIWGISNILLNLSSVSFCSTATLFIFYAFTQHIFIECLQRSSNYAKWLKFLVKYPDISAQPQRCQNLDELQIVFLKAYIFQDLFLKLDNKKNVYCKIKINKFSKTENVSHEESPAWNPYFFTWGTCPSWTRTTAFFLSLRGYHRGWIPWTYPLECELFMFTPRKTALFSLSGREKSHDWFCFPLHTVHQEAQNQLCGPNRYQCVELFGLHFCLVAIPWSWLPFIVCDFHHSRVFIFWLSPEGCFDYIPKTTCAIRPSIHN